MATTVQRESAKIYTFPSAARAAASSFVGQAKPVADLASKRLPKTVFGEGWYHEAAIQEEQDRKR